MSSGGRKLSKALALILICSPAYADQDDALGAAAKCVASTAVRYARHTTETAEMVASYAARTCVKDIEKTSDAAVGRDMIFKTLVSHFSLKVVQWRTRAAAIGPQEYDAVELEIQSLPSKDILHQLD